MKTLKLIVVLIFVSLDLYSQEINKSEKVNLYSCLKESFILSNCNKTDCSCFTETWEMKILSKCGECFFNDFDKKEFENQSIKFIFDHFSNKYEYLGSEIYHGYEFLKSDDKYLRNTFLFFFKLDDTTLLRLYGCINVDRSKVIKNNKKALEYILLQNEYVMNFTQLNVSGYLKVITKEDIKFFEKINRSEWITIKKHYLYLFPKVKRKKGN